MVRRVLSRGLLGRGVSDWIWRHINEDTLHKHQVTWYITVWSLVVKLIIL